MLTTKDWWDDFPDLEQDLEEIFTQYYRNI